MLRGAGLSSLSDPPYAGLTVRPSRGPYTKGNTYVSGMSEGKRRMGPTSNPRKLYQSGNGIVVSLPPKILKAAELTKGDRVVLEAEEGKIIARKAEFRTVKADE